MPHQCTNCGHVFADGSKEMLRGCPDCGGNKFQYHPGAVPDEPTQAEPPERPGEGGVAGTVGKAAAKVRDFVGDDPARAHPDSDADTATAASERTTPSASSDATAETAASDGTDAEEVPERDAEDLAQQSARSEMVGADDLPDTERPPASERGRVVAEPSVDERPDMEQLREELNSQFESIRIVSPGQYELNLMELYDREEYIIALQENGRYVIEVPDAWEVQDADDHE